MLHVQEGLCSKVAPSCRVDSEVHPSKGHPLDVLRCYVSLISFLCQQGSYISDGFKEHLSCPTFSYDLHEFKVGLFCLQRICSWCMTFYHNGKFLATCTIAPNKMTEWRRFSCLCCACIFEPMSMASLILSTKHKPQQTLTWQDRLIKIDSQVLAGDSPCLSEMLHTTPPIPPKVLPKTF